MITSSGDKFGTVSGILEASDGTLWLNEIRGLTRIAPDQVRDLAANPRHRVTYQLFDHLDGLPGAPQMDVTVSTAVEASDGRLWFATDGGLARLDPTSWPKNTVPPPVSIVSVIADQSYSPGGDLRFPVGTSRVQIGFAALSLAIPERVRVLYMLEGVDRDWQEAGARRESFYTNAKPGKYTFRVKASRLERLYQERMDERTRIARKLHGARCCCGASPPITGAGAG